MDMELAYAHGRVLSLKRLLGHKHISHRRIRTSMEFGRERKLVLELEVPSWARKNSVVGGGEFSRGLTKLGKKRFWTSQIMCFDFFWIRSE